MFWETTKSFSTTAVPFYIPTSNVWRVPSIPPPTLLMTCLFLLQCSTGYAVVWYCGFSLCFPDGCWCREYFHRLFGYFYIFFGEMTVQILWPFKLFLFKSLVARDFIQVVIRYIICTFFSQYVGCLSLFSVISLAVQFFRFLFSPVCFFSFAACTFSFIS